MIVCKDSEGNEGDPCPLGGVAGRDMGDGGRDKEDMVMRVGGL